MDKSESVDWPNVWWILGADYLIFEELWVISEKNILQIDFEKKKDANKFLKKMISSLKKISLMTYNAEEIKSYTVICRGKNF